MKLSIRKKILLVVANALVLMIAMAAVVSWGFNGINSNKDTTVHELHAIVTGEASSSSRTLPNDRDNAAFAFNSKTKATTAQAASAHELQNF